MTVGGAPKVSSTTGNTMKPTTLKAKFTQGVVKPAPTPTPKVPKSNRSGIPASPPKRALRRNSLTPRSPY